MKLIESILADAAAKGLELQQLSQKLETTRQMSLMDPEIQVGSRRFFNQRLKEEFQRSARAKTTFCLILLQIRCGTKKALKDSPDFLVSIRQAAAALKASLRAFDMVMRYADDTLAIILPETPRSEAERILRRLVAGLQASPEPCREPAAPPSPSPEIASGVAEYPADATTIEMLKAIAESALEQHSASRVPGLPPPGKSPAKPSAGPIPFPEELL